MPLNKKDLDPENQNLKASLPRVADFQNKTNNEQEKSKRHQD
jgi:hypothetical protein